MKKILYSIVTCTFLICTSNDLQAQNILNKIERGVQTTKDVSRNIKKNKEKQQEKEEPTNPKSVEKSTFHEQQLSDSQSDENSSKKSGGYKPRVGKILFANGAANPNLQESGQFVTTVDLNSPSFFNVYLEDPLFSIHARVNKLDEYSFAPPAFIRKYYINNELIATYTDQIDREDFKNKTVHSDVLVPSNQMDYANNEMRMGVLAHVFSALNDGTHKLKVEYVMIKSTPKPSSTGSAATEFDNEEYVVASGEVDVKADANSVNNYAKKYGRPKFTKGVLQSDSKLEQQLVQLIKNDSKREVVYMYASDNWKILRGYLDTIVGREAQIYYVFKNDKGRCELSDFKVHQDYEGNKYGAPTFGYSTSAPAFKYVVCQNY